MPARPSKRTARRSGVPTDTRFQYAGLKRHFGIVAGEPPSVQPIPTTSELSYYEHLKADVPQTQVLDATGINNMYDKDDKSRVDCFAREGRLFYETDGPMLLTFGFSTKALLDLLKDYVANAPSAKSLGKRKQAEPVTTSSSKRLKTEDGYIAVNGDMSFKRLVKHVLELNVLRDDQMHDDELNEIVTILQERPELSEHVFSLDTSFAQNNHMLALSQLNENAGDTKSDTLFSSRTSFLAGVDSTICNILCNDDKKKIMTENSITMEVTCTVRAGPSPSASLDDKQRPFHIVFSTQLSITTGLIDATLGPSLQTARADMLKRLVGTDERINDGYKLTTEWFYEQLKPPAKQSASVLLKPKGFKSTLLPFQSDNVIWLLRREGSTYLWREADQAHLAVPLDQAELEHASVNPFWDEMKFGDTSVWFSAANGSCTRQEPPSSLHRGMLCDEMGLGKNKDPDRSQEQAYDCPDQQIRVQPSNLTLILCPLSILNQWTVEVAKHTTSLRVYVYQGVKSLKPSVTAKSIDRDYDIVLCSFETLGKEVDYARAPPDRVTRFGSERPKIRRSLLIEIDFLRVCMDEVQMAHNVAGRVAETASYIKRKYAFAVSGTPLRSDVDDLRGLLYFLGFDDVSGRKSVEELLRQPQVVSRVLAHLAIRSTKDAVADQIGLPRQDRFIVPLEFGPIEAVAYKNRYIDAITGLGLDAGGEAPSADWRPSLGAMLAALTRLRHVCCHTQIGQNRPQTAANASKPKGPKTLNEVLAQMRMENSNAYYSTLRAQHAATTKRGHLIARDREDCTGLETGLGVLKGVILEIEQLIDQLRSEVTKEKAEDVTGEKELIIRSVGSGRIRDNMTLLHTAIFYLANIFNTIGNRQAEETDAYERAEALRRQILEEEETTAAKAIVKLVNALKTAELSESQLELEGPEENGGIQTSPVFDAIDETIDQANVQSKLLWKWRKMLCDKLLIKVRTESADATEFDYDNDAARQEEIDVLVDAYSKMLTDWKFGLTGEKVDSGNDAQSLTVQEIRQRLDEMAKQGNLEAPAKKRSKLKKQQGIQYQLALDMTRAGHKLFADIETEREMAMKEDTTNLRALSRRLKDICESGTRHEEVTLANAEIFRLRAILLASDKTYDAFYKELHDEILPCFNARGGYYIALQRLSDAVIDIDLKATKTKNVMAEIESARGEEIRSMQAVAAIAAKRRYLDFLNQNLRDVPKEDRICSVCSDQFDNGIFTMCGHIFCSSCLGKWLSRSRTCPICKTELRRSDYHEITFDEKGKAEMEKVMQAAAYEAAPTKNVTALSFLGEEKIKEITSLPDIGSHLGIKIDTIVKHIRLLRQRDASAKVVLFSAWQQALDVCALTFQAKGIRFVRFDRGNSNTKQDKTTRANAQAEFVNNPEIAVFILHTQSQAAGLNLTAAQTVILVEPLMHPSIELQAVGRVHRIGQESETAVYQYIIRDTVDERLAQMNARKGHPLFLETRPFLREDGTSSASPAKDHRDAPPSPNSAGRFARSGKNAEEELLDDVEEDDLARVVLEDREYATLQTCLLQQKSLASEGEEEDAEIDESRNAAPAPRVNAVAPMDVDDEGTESDDVQIIS